MLQFRMFAATQLRSTFPPSQLRALGDLCVKNSPSLDSDFHTPRRPSAKSGQNNFFQFSVLRTLPSSVSRNSFVCDSYENCRVYINNSHSGLPRAVCAKGTRYSPISTLVISPDLVSKDSFSTALFAHSFRSLHKERFTTLLQSGGSALFLKTAGWQGYFKPKSSKNNLKRHCIQVFSFHILAHSFAPQKIISLFLSGTSTLFAQKHPGVGGGGVMLTSRLSVQRAQSFCGTPSPDDPSTAHCPLAFAAGCIIPRRSRSEIEDSMRRRHDWRAEGES